MRDFVRNNREEIDRCIRRVCPNLERLNDNARKQWVINCLYNWAKAKQEGVKL